jgi:virginiamycin B lyase
MDVRTLTCRRVAAARIVAEATHPQPPRSTVRLSRLVLLTVVLSLLPVAVAAAAPIATLKQYRLPAKSGPRYITNGADGNRWFTEGNDVVPPHIGRITPAGSVTEFGSVCQSCILNDVAQGPGNILYYTENDAFLGRITTSGTVLAPIPMPSSLADAGNLAVDSARGAIWITDFNDDVIWRYDIAGGTFTSPISASDPTDVAVGAGGDVWFTENNTPGNVGHYSAATQTTTRTPTQGVPREITVASDGDIWFTELFPPEGIGRLDPATNAVTEFPLSNAGPQSIAPAADGSVWFTQTTTGNVASITDAGTITEGKAVKGSQPDGIAIDASGNPWYTLSSADKIAELKLR